LTTVHSPVYQMGYDAARLLHQTMCKRVTTPAQIHLPVELVVRESA
jgi:DNA-binding LacI/PurR family transcriptional regulator